MGPHSHKQRCSLCDIRKKKVCYRFSLSKVWRKNRQSICKFRKKHFFSFLKKNRPYLFELITHQVWILWKGAQFCVISGKYITKTQNTFKIEFMLFITVKKQVAWIARHRECHVVVLKILCLVFSQFIIAGRKEKKRLVSSFPPLLITCASVVSEYFLPSIF